MLIVHNAYNYVLWETLLGCATFVHVACVFGLWKNCEFSTFSVSIFHPTEFGYDEDETLGGLYELPPQPPTRTPSRKTTSPEHLPKPPPRGESLYSRVTRLHSQLIIC